MAGRLASRSWTERATKMFRAASTPAPIPPPPPEPPPARSDPIVLQNEQREASRRKRGRASTLLTGPAGDTSAPQVSAAQLLGRVG